MNCFRMIDAYVVHRNDPGGPVAHIGALAPWDHVFKDTIYATQEILGDAVAVRMPVAHNFPELTLISRYTEHGLSGVATGVQWSYPAACLSFL